MSDAQHTALLSALAQITAVLQSLTPNPVAPPQPIPIVPTSDSTAGPSDAPPPAPRPPPPAVPTSDPTAGPSDAPPPAPRPPPAAPPPVAPAPNPAPPANPSAATSVPPMLVVLPLGPPKSRFKLSADGDGAMIVERVD